MTKCRHDVSEDCPACAEETIASLTSALRGMVDLYCDLVNSGDAGFWDPEKIDEVKRAREAMRHLVGPGPQPVSSFAGCIQPSVPGDTGGDW